MKGKRILKALFAMLLLLNIVFAVGENVEAAESEITATSMLYSTTKAPAYTKVKLAPGEYEIIPVTAKHTGWMSVDYFVEGLATSNYYEDAVRIGVVDEENANLFEQDPENADYEYLEYSSYRFREDKEELSYERIYMKKGTVYYFLIINESPNVSVTAGVRAKLYTTIQRTLEQRTDRWTTVTTRDKEDNYKATWFKVTPKTTGVMTVTLKEFGYDGSSGYVTLLNSNQKSISDKVSYYNWPGYTKRHVYFGVKKGVTYYLKVEGCYGSYKEDYKIGVKYSVTERKDRAIGKKANALTLKRKADATNTLFVASNSTSTDWYKFKVTQKRTTEFSVDTRSIKSGSIKLSVYRGNEQVGYEKTLYPNSQVYKFSITYGTDYDKANAGTYYIKLTKDKKASGKYAVRYIK